MTFELGQHVEHPTWGLGKILFVDATVVHAYFKGEAAAIPEKRVKKVAEQGWGLLTPVDAQPDDVLDGLPPWNGTGFVRPKTELTIEEAKRSFLRMFEGGIDDPAFVAQEIEYKRGATGRFNNDFLPRAAAWIEAGDVAAIARGVEHVWGRHLPSKSRLNLLYHMGEEPAYFEALHTGGARTLEYATALIELLELDTDASFNRLIKALEALPTREGGFDIAKWPPLTTLPFIAAPRRHIVVRPSIIQAFASAYPREINYRSELNVLTYRCVREFSEDFRRVLQASEVNLAGRELDLMDVQSFMWAVAKYKRLDVEKAAKAVGSGPV